MPLVHTAVLNPNHLICKKKSNFYKSPRVRPLYVISLRKFALRLLSQRAHIPSRYIYTSVAHAASACTIFYRINATKNCHPSKFGVILINYRDHPSFEWHILAHLCLGTIINILHVKCDGVGGFDDVRNTRELSLRCEHLYNKHGLYLMVRTMMNTLI